MEIFITDNFNDYEFVYESSIAKRALHLLFAIHVSLAKVLNLSEP